MKIVKRLALMLLLLMSMAFSIVSYADETTLNDNGKPAIQYQQLPANRISYNVKSDRDPIDIVYFVCDMDGNFTYYKDENHIMPKATSAFLGSYYFYDMGYSDGSQFYEAGFEAVASNGLTFTWHKFSAKPTYNKTWLVSSAYHANRDPIADAIYYGYPDAGPKTPKCQVKITATLSDGNTYTTDTRTLSKPTQP